MFRWPALPGAWLRAGVAPTLTFLAAVTDRNFLADYWFHLARGKSLAELGRWTDPEVYAYTLRDRVGPDGNWLTQHLYFQLHSAGGLDLVQLVNALVLAATVGLVVAACRRRGGSLTAAAGVTLFVFLGLWQILTVRPQTFSLFLFVLLYCILDRAEQRRLWLLAPPLVVALWVNLHGAFPGGLLLVGGFLVSAVLETGWGAGWRGTVNRRTIPLALCLAACALATLANPYGWRLLDFVRVTMSTASARGLDEWLPPSLDWFVGRVWLCSLLAALVAFALPKRPEVRDVVLVLCFLPPALASARMIPWWLFVLAPVLARQLAINLPLLAALDRDERPSATTTACCAGLVLVVVFSLPGLSAYNPLLGPGRRAPRLEADLASVDLPPGAAPGRLFSRFEWGGFLSWRHAPRYRIFMDAMMDNYPEEVWRQYQVVTLGRDGWEGILDRYKVGCLVLDRDFHARTGLLARVERSGTWERTGGAGRVVVYGRTARLPVGDDRAALKLPQQHQEVLDVVGLAALGGAVVAVDQPEFKSQVPLRID